jgi:SMODS and SLOG-associating 2TM effector domain 2
VTEPPPFPLSRPSAGPVRSDDLRAARLPDIRWDGDDVRPYLTELYDWADRFANETISWYLDEKAGKSRWSRGLRALAAIFATLGGIVPLAALTLGRPALGNGGFVLLGLAAGCVAYDRYFGYSSAWLRYVSAAMNLRAQLTDFQLSWTREMALLGSRPLPVDEASRLIDMVRAFATGVNGVVRDETESWLVEFHTRLAELESTLRQSTLPPVEGSPPQPAP